MKRGPYLSEAERLPLVCPIRREILEQCIEREIWRLSAIEYGRRDVRREKGASNQPAYIFVIDPVLFGNRSLAGGAGEKLLRTRHAPRHRFDEREVRLRG